MNIIYRSKSFRFKAISERLDRENINYKVCDFDDADWINFDFKSVSTIFYYPYFTGNPTNPHSLFNVMDNLCFISNKYPHIKIFPDPSLSKYYNDKYQQYLYLISHDYPIPETIALSSAKQLDVVIKQLSLPLILKNRHGAGGDSVYLVNTEREVAKYFQFALGNFSPFIPLKILGLKRALKSIAMILLKPGSYKRTTLSLPLIAQKKIDFEGDIRVVVINGKVWEAHWRFCNNKREWKANIDSGGKGIWCHIPENVIAVCEKLAKELNTKWLAVDILYNKGAYYITEFSPVWHHYKINEKENFFYEADYNITTSIEEGHDLEGMFIKTLFSNP